MQGDSDNECHRYLKLPHRREQGQCQAGFILDTVDSALLTAPYFLCCTEPQIVWDRLIGFLHCAAWPHPSMRKQQITKSIKAPLFLGDK